MSTQHTVLIQNFAFVPDDLVIDVGDSAVWTNQDSVDHTATSDPDQPVTWDTGTVAPGMTSDPVPFNTVGVSHYHCTFHPDMKADIRSVVTH